MLLPGPLGFAGPRGSTTTRAGGGTAGLDDGTASPPEPPEFADVDEGSVHAESIGCIAALGITRGTAAGMFSPSDTVTRAQMASFLTRFYEQLTGTA